MKLIYKLFAAFLLTSLMIILLMAGIMQYFASRHFADYVGKVEIGRLTDVVEMLKSEYQKNQGWQQFERNRLLWDEIIRQHQQKGNADLLPPPPRPMDIEGKKEEPIGRALPPPPPHIAHVLSLYDAQKRLIIGRPDEPRNQILREINIDGNTIGWLGLSRPRNATDPLQLHFIYQQTRAFILVGCGTLLLAAFVAFLLSRHLLKPIRQLMFGAHAMASRRFDSRVNVHSSDELGDLADDFNKMAGTLERYESMRRQWISDIAHELRTPLAVLRGEIEAVMDGVRDLRKETLESLHAEVMLLTKIVNDLHTLTVVESEALAISREPVKILQVADDMLKLFLPRFEGSGIKVQHDLIPDPDITVMGDPDRLVQVFSNIFENSLRYTDAPGKIRLRQEQEGGMLRLYFEDSAPGVPDSSMPFIFDRMYRVDRSRSRKKGGSGLGLAISKAIVEGHGGDITAAHSPFGGLQIVIELPLSTEPSSD